MNILLKTSKKIESVASIKSRYPGMKTWEEIGINLVSLRSRRKQVTGNHSATMESTLSISGDLTPYMKD